MTAFVSYVEAPSAGSLGKFASTTDGALGRTIVRVTDAAIDRALFVVEGAVPGKTCKAIDNAAGKIKGLTLDPEYLNELGLVATSYSAGQQATLAIEGEVWVNSEDTVVYDGEVFARHTSDGGSNTVLGTLRADAGAAAAASIVLDVGAAADAQEGQYTLRLFNGVSEATFAYTTDGSALASEVIAALVAAVNAHADYAATGTTEVTITRVTGNRIEVREFSGPNQTAQDALSITDNQECVLVPGARFSLARTGAGLTRVKLAL